MNVNNLALLGHRCLSCKLQCWEMSYRLSVEHNYAFEPPVLDDNICGTAAHSHDDEDSHSEITQ